jgi:hypothetical protein
VYHVELRHFPHNMCRFNLSAQELRATVLEPWARDRLIEFGERKWDPQRAKLTILDGPPIAPGQLTMGRGWRTAQRQGREVTDELLAGAREALAADTLGGVGSQGSASTHAAAGALRGAVGEEADLAADSLGLELLARIGGERAALYEAWGLARERSPGIAASASLALAERAVASLLRARLIVLLRGASAGEEPAEVGEGEAPAVLAAPESWAGAADAGSVTGVWLRRA